MKKFTLGRTIANNEPCILVDGDSVFAIFPSMPRGEDQAREVCAMLNLLATIATDASEYPNVFN